MVVIYRNKINEEKKIYQYVDKYNNIITDKKILDYIDNMQPVPPAYNDARIYYEKNPKVLFDGRDKKGKLQQIYSAKYRATADKDKFAALIEFGYKLSTINAQIQKNIKSVVLTKNKVIALILLLIQECGFRIGQLAYYKLNKSIGLSTLMAKHLTFKSKSLLIKFSGKKSVENSCTITDTQIIKQLHNIAVTKKPNDFMFSYYDGPDEMLLSGDDINTWLKTYGEDFTTKMFRTFTTNVLFIDLMQHTAPHTLSEAQRKKKIKEVLEVLACSINNSPAICKKSYLSTDLLNLYIQHGRKYETDINKSTGSAEQKFIIFLENT